MKQRLLTSIITLCMLLCVVVPVQAEAPSPFWVERQIYQYLTEELQLNSAAACGVLANIEHESAFDLTIVGDYGTSFGLCQWHNERYTALVNFCGSQGLNYRSVEGQMMYLSYELKTGYFSILASLRNVEDTPEGAYRAGYIWCIQFERPANAQVRAVERGTTAQYKYWNRYHSGSSVSIPSVSFVDMIPEVEEEPVMVELPTPTHQVDVTYAAEETFSRIEGVQVHPEPEFRSHAAPEAPAETPAEQRRIAMRPFPVRHYQTVVVSQVQPDYSTGVAVGLSLLPMGDGRKRELKLFVPEAEPISV